MAKVGMGRKAGKTSHKGRQRVHHKEVGKYIRQAARTLRNKLRAWKAHLEQHPNDLQFKKVYNRLTSQI